MPASHIDRYAAASLVQRTDELQIKFDNSGSKVIISVGSVSASLQTPTLQQTHRKRKNRMYERIEEACQMSEVWLRWKGRLSLGSTFGATLNINVGGILTLHNSVLDRNIHDTVLICDRKIE